MKKNNKARKKAKISITNQALTSFYQFSILRLLFYEASIFCPFTHPISTTGIRFDSYRYKKIFLSLM